MARASIEGQSHRGSYGTINVSSRNSQHSPSMLQVSTRREVLHLRQRILRMAVLLHCCLEFCRRASEAPSNKGLASKFCATTSIERRAEDMAGCTFGGQRAISHPGLCCQSGQPKLEIDRAKSPVPRARPSRCSKFVLSGIARRDPWGRRVDHPHSSAVQHSLPLQVPPQTPKDCHAQHSAAWESISEA